MKNNKINSKKKSPKTILVTGGSGLLGSNFIKLLSKQKKFNLICVYNDNKTSFRNCKNIKADITKSSDVKKLIKLKPDIIIHCAALTNIKFCEENKELAHKINIIGTKNIAGLAKLTKSKLVYLSTDMVFDGTKGNYSEDDIPNPLTIYGKTKFEGEKICLNLLENSLVIRTSVFGIVNSLSQRSFVESVLTNLRIRKEYNAFIDVINSPIYIYYLMDIILKLIKNNAKGIFHVSGNENISRYDFAKKIAREFRYEEELIKKSSVENISKEVNYSKNVSLNNKKLFKLFKISPPSIDKMIKLFRKEYKKVYFTI